MDVLNHMDSRNRIGVVVWKGELPNVTPNLGIVGKIDGYPFVPSNISRAEMEAHRAFWIASLHAFACVLGE